MKYCYTIYNIYVIKLKDSDKFIDYKYLYTSYRLDNFIIEEIYDINSNVLCEDKILNINKEDLIKKISIYGNTKTLFCKKIINFYIGLEFFHLNYTINGNITFYVDDEKNL
jgi:hypothetical protein